ncbi:MAG: hypothetical protein GXY48_11720 [Methanomicrobiales archaeon]|nr:hypothetical protein [Methanomicrobiales archaeon]
MRIIRSNRHKYCADGSFMKEFVLDSEVTPEFLDFLKRFGTLEMLPGLGEGFYKFEKKDCFSIKGFVNESGFEVRFKKEVMDFTSDFLYSLLYYYQNGKPDFKTLSRREEALIERVKTRLYGSSS